MAKKVKFPLKMKDGSLVRTMEELRENFDIDSLLEQFESGKLLTWLEDRYYDVEAEKVRKLDRNSKNFARSLCECLGIEAQEEALSDVDMDFLKRRVEKQDFLKSITSDEMILNKVDDIAITQEDLIDLIDMGKDTIYLCKGDFTVPVSVPNMTYIGIYEPCVVVRATDNVNFKKQNIVFKDVPFIWDISSVSIRDRSYQAERMFMEGRYEEAKKICLDLVEEDNPRSIMLLYRIYASFLCNAPESIKCKEKGAKLNDAYSLIDNEKWEFIERYKKALRKNAVSGTSFDKYYYSFALYKWGAYNNGNYDGEMMAFLLEAAKQGNPVANSGIGYRYKSGQGVGQDYQKTIEWNLKAIKNENADSMESLANCYENGYGVPQDYVKALEWRKKAAEKGYNISVSNIGWHYRYGKGVNQDYLEAMKWYLQAAEQGSAYSQRNLGDLYYNGYGVSRDLQKAKEWYQKAADNGDSEAKEALKKF